jgi:hypothetical protein
MVFTHPGAKSTLRKGRLRSRSIGLREDWIPRQAGGTTYWSSQAVR